MRYRELARNPAQVEALKAAASQRIVQGQGELNLGLNPVEIGSGTRAVFAP
ncbi:hypothetical protein [Mycobacterium canetti]|uniref:hypothetical protein n=1 Tax=Mycobacterium canetti TaxID=78331 RepID=UPI0002D4F893|nr:hypothetical protein [Mycobacterium canetti]